ncbi:MAG: BamA/TamA family outer membrane protein [Bacteroidales bacterium]|nr:BamA/TamA family outer membrane protein [Bacteroidales bacterium]
MKWRIAIIIALCLLGAAACSTTRSLGEGEYLLRKNSIVADDPSFNVSALNSYVGQKPNSYILGLNPLLSVYNWSGDGSTPFKRFLRKIGAAPVVYDSLKVSQSVANLENHLQYTGYYGSRVSSRVDTVKKKAYVTYSVNLGNRYKISEIAYDIPEYGTFREDFLQGLDQSSVKAGEYLSESALDKEADRSAAHLRTLGYYGFTKSFYAFEADTLTHDGTALLTYSIRDYALGDAPSSAKEHKKFYLGEVTITHPERLKIRPNVLENLNILRPGQLYNEDDVNTNYTRFSSVGMLTGVNINLEPVADDKVDCTISLRNSGLQGFKTNLEASVNSTGLFGISPQLTYYHRNIFHGGEQLNLGLKGNFQFQPRTKAYSTDLSISSTLRFPKFIGLPNRIFTGPNIPRTDVSAAFSYQDRPEFRRTVISTAFTYNGRLGQNFYYQLSPVRLNISHLYNIDEEFMMKLLMNNPLVLMAYMDRFDLGVSGMLYYTTDASSVPLTPYHYIRISSDISGNFLSLFNRWMPTDESGYHTIWNTPYAQYVRTELNMGKVFRFGKEDKHALALHFGGGVAYAYGNSDTPPIEKQFYVGGSMSMRGWNARNLGPGNSAPITWFTIPSQIGEMKLEANVEYRFPLISKLEGALFVDAGNIWDISGDSENEGRFSFSNLPQSIALDWGLGARVNLNFLLLRVDMGIRLRDPAREAGSRWVPSNEWLNGNYAIHFGVGYPF